MLKLESLVPETLRRMKKLNPERVMEVKETGKRNHLYTRNFEVWFANTIKYACYTSSEICEMYRNYRCNDSHITSLFIHCCKVMGWL